MMTHLFFADDSLLFCKANTQECQKLIEILKLYEVALSQKINIDKSSIFFSHNTPQQLRDDVFNTLGPYARITAQQILGAALNCRKEKKIEVFAEIKERVGKKLFGWK